MQQGKYIVTQVNAPDGYSIDKLSKIVQLGTNQNFATATFTSDAHVNQSNKTNSGSRNSHDITYNSKFECGSIVGDKGPFRPGHYDTDISIFNRQDYPGWHNV